MRFVVIDPYKAAVDFVEAQELTDVYPVAGIQRGEVDFGTIYRDRTGPYTVAIVVYEFGLKKPPSAGKYFSIGRSLYEGGAVLFAADEMGDTISMEHKPPVVFYRSFLEVEQAIARGDIIRPITAVNDEVLWQWGIDTP